ncbi:MAG: hypothetical protein KBD01_02835 [Acidobacteria bacterium]|nr:hypothetical protein [Acidobacteriota bacterium]
MITLLVLAGLALGGACLVYVYFAQQRQDQGRRQRERATWLAHDRAAKATSAVERVARFYPFLLRELEAVSVATEKSGTAVRDLLQSLPGISIGVGPHDIPAVLAHSRRPSHVLLLARSGGGKTVLLTRVLAHDLGHTSVVVIGAERDAFRRLVLPFVPPARAKDTVYWALGDEACPVGLNACDVPAGASPARYAGDLYHIWKQGSEEDSIGGRSDAIVWNTLAVLVAAPGTSFLSIRPILEDASFRAGLLEHVTDSEVRNYWTSSFPRLPASAIQPFLNRVTRILSPAIRRAFCAEQNTFSLRGVLDSGVLLVDTSGLPPDERRLAAQLVLAMIQLCIEQRDEIDEGARPRTHLFIDEFSTLAGTSEHTWRELFSRSRRMGLGLFLTLQHTAALPTAIRAELLTNSSTLIALPLGAKDAALLNREFLVPSTTGGTAAIPSARLIDSGVGSGYLRTAPGAVAMPVRFHPPLAERPIADGERIKSVSWKTHGASRPPEAGPPPVMARSAPCPPAEPPLSGLPGRGGSQHKFLQQFVAQVGSERGFRSDLELSILAGTGRVDVALMRDDLRIAVEIAITMTPERVAASVTKSLAAGFDRVVVLAPDQNLRRRIEPELAAALGSKERERVHVGGAETLVALLDEVQTPTSSDQPAGYRLSVRQVEVPPVRATANRATLARIVGDALLRRTQ